MEMSETDVKTDGPYTRHLKVTVTGCPLYTFAEISVLLWLVGVGGAACSLIYKRETKMSLKAKINLIRYYSILIVGLEENIY